MADPLALNDIVAITIVGTVANQHVENVLHFKADNPPDPAEDYTDGLQSLIGSIKNDVASGIFASLLDCIGNNVGIDYVQAQRVYPQRDFYTRIYEAQPGLHANECSLSNIAATVTKQSERAGRGRSGSFHVFGIPDGVWVDGVWDGAYLALLDELADNLINNQREFGGLDVWWPGMFNGSLGAGNNWSGIVGCTPGDTVRVMRRRTVRLGI